MTVADAALLLAGTRTMTALLEIGEDDAAIADAAAPVALRAFDGSPSVAFFTGHGLVPLIFSYSLLRIHASAASMVSTQRMRT